MSPVPRVDVAFPAVPAGTQRATVFCITSEQTRRVRGAINVYAAGGFAVIDTEPPFGSPAPPVLTYRAEFFNGSGASLGFSDAASTQVLFSGTVIHQPVAPERSALVVAEMGMAAELERPFEGNLIRPMGRSVPVYVGRGRSGLQAVNLTCITATAAEAQKFASVFGGYNDVQLPVICVRTSHAMGLPQPLFAVVRNPRRVAADARTGGETVVWQMEGDEVAPPVEAVALAILTYADIEAAFPTYAAMEAAYLTYFDMESDFNKAGTA